MGFAAPSQLIWSVALIAVVLLYWRWSSRTKQTTAALPIWKQALARRTLWSRWRRAVSLLAACAPIVLIALALAQPYLWPAVRSARTLVVVMDTTAGMNAGAEGQTRLGEAKEQARRLIDELRTHEQMAILSADSAVHVRCGATADRKLLHAALNAIGPTDGTGAVPAAVATAQRLAAARRNGVVVLFSDGAFSGADEFVDGKKVVLIPIGAKADNVAITRLAARPQPGSASTYDVLVEVANFGQAAVKTTVQLDGENGAKQQVPFEVAAGAKAQRVVAIVLNEPGALTARLNHDDALAADNWAQLLLSPPRNTRVVLIADADDSALAAALRSMEGIELDVSNALPDDLPKESAELIIVYDGAAPDQLPPHPALVVAPAKSSDHWEYVGQIDAPGAISERPHGLPSGIDLQDVIVDTSARLRFAADENVQILATTADGSPAVARIEGEDGDVVVLAFGPAGSDLALRDAFPPLIAAAIAWLGRSNRPRASDWTTASLLDLPEAAVTLQSPYGASYRIDAGRPLLADLAQVGQWHIAHEAGDAQAVLPVNLLNASESDVNPRAAVASSGWPNSPTWPDLGRLWPMLAALALVWIVGHWVLLQRNVID